MITRELSSEVIHSYDVAVVGGGMVGLSAALGFARLGLRVVILEAHVIQTPDSLDTPSFDARSTALSYGSALILRQLGAWEGMASSVSPISNVHVSQKGKMGVSRIAANEMKCPVLGYVAPNQTIGAGLLGALSDFPVTLLCQCTVVSLQVDQHVTELSIQLNDQVRSLRADLVVIADGSQSKTAQMIGVEYAVQPYRQHALIANVSFQAGHGGVAYERFTTKGPMALLPLSHNEMSLVWTIPDDEINWYQSASDAALGRRLQSVFGDRLGLVQRVGERVIYPLNLIQAKELHRRGIIILGNAAHSLHPVAGQGFNLALRGVARAIEAVAEAVCSNKAISSPKVLARAISAHRSDQHVTVGLSDQLVKKFSQSLPLFGLLREAGLVGLNNSTLPKQLFARQTMGQGGREVPLNHLFEKVPI